MTSPEGPAQQSLAAARRRCRRRRQRRQALQRTAYWRVSQGELLTTRTRACKRKDTRREPIWLRKYLYRIIRILFIFLSLENGVVVFFLHAWIRPSLNVLHDLLNFLKFMNEKDSRQFNCGETQKNVHQHWYKKYESDKNTDS